MYEIGHADYKNVCEEVVTVHIAFVSSDLLFYAKHLNVISLIR
jgi:hypothetical protein